ncbi:MAG: 4'-phosphopantetheinyl transferase superfamily protein [Firmicutes bacterium]|nr:4'-phosphopantetheinyl transferase superfamily protein [Bacillota bacterium]
MKLFLWDQSRQAADSRQLLRTAILQYETAKQNRTKHGEPVEESLFVIRQAPGGKPYPARPDGSPLTLQVSVSHTGRWWMCAVGRGPVGLDGELRSRSVKRSVVRRICTEQELEWLTADGDDEEQIRRRLLWIWVRKEAYVKYLGTGISRGLKTFSVIEEGNQADGFLTVDWRSVSEEAAEELETALYAPGECVEGMEWIRWK